MTIRPMKSEDIHEVSRMHELTLPCTTSSKIGSAYLKTLYKILIANKNHHYSIVAVENQKIVGALSATLDLRKTNKKVSPLRKPRLIFEIFLSLVGGKITPKDLIKRLIFERNLLKNNVSSYPTILTLFVVLGNQKKGVGRKLIGHCLNNFKNRGVKFLFVDTLLSNTAAQEFYTKMGFTKYATIDDSVVYKINL